MKKWRQTGHAQIILNGFFQACTEQSGLNVEVQLDKIFDKTFLRPPSQTKTHFKTAFGKVNVSSLKRDLAQREQHHV